MKSLRAIVQRVSAALRPGKVDAEMTEEMRLHLEQRIRENIAAGMAPDEAAYAAYRRFGGVEHVKETARAQRCFAWLEHLRQDLRYAGRTLSKHAGFTAVAVATLALGIGVNTTMFSVIYGVLLDPYPYEKSSEIWAPQLINAKTGRGIGGFRVGDYLELAQLPAVQAAMATSFGNATLRGEAVPEIVAAPRLSSSAFGFLGVPPVMGRTFAEADFKSNGEGEAVTVLSFKLWQRLFNGDPSAIGRTLVLNDTPHVILGVMPPRFGWYTNDGLWLPLATTDRQAGVMPILRLAPEVTQALAEQQLYSLAERMGQESPGRLPKDGFKARLVNYLDVSVSSGEMRSSLHLLFGAVGFLLLIACTNVANLQLARAATRGREIAIRMAIGASRARVVRQLLTESVALSLVAGALGVLLAFALTKVVVSLMPQFYVPNEARVTLNLWVLLFSVGISVVTGVLFGLAPGLQCTRPDLTVALKSGGHAAGVGDARATRTRNSLVVAEVALAVVLLVGAGLAARGFVDLQRIDRGFRTERALLMRVPLVPKRYVTLEQRNGFARDFIARLQQLPGVSGVAVGMLPGYEASSGIVVPGQPKPPDQAALSFVSVDYVPTWGLMLRAGRDFTAQEIAQGARVALITETTAKFWPGGVDPVGRILEVDSLGSGSQPSNPAGATKAVTVIGIVADSRARNLRQDPPAAVLLPYTLRGQPNPLFVIRTHTDPGGLLNLARAELRALDPEQPILRPATIEELMGQQTVQPRFNLALFAGLAGIALVLAAAGIYSVLSYHVTQRTREIGVRVALGATRGNILRLVVGAGGRLVGIGLLLGAVVSIALGKILTTQVFTVPLLDPAALGMAGGLLGLAGLLACLIPGRRATKVDPMVALRAD